MTATTSIDRRQALDEHLADAGQPMQHRYIPPPGSISFKRDDDEGAGDRVDGDEAAAAAEPASNDDIARELPRREAEERSRGQTEQGTLLSADVAFQQHLVGVKAKHKDAVPGRDVRIQADALRGANQRRFWGSYDGIVQPMPASRGKGH